MPANDRGSLRNAFANFNRPDADKEAELKLLGRTVEAPLPSEPVMPELPDTPSPSPLVATIQQVAGGLVPRPLLHREAVRQLSFRCPVSLAQELRRKAAFNQLEQQQIIIEGIKRVLLELPSPPDNWQE